MKRCVCCDEPKPLSEFDPHPATADLLYRRCRSCQAEVQAKVRSYGAPPAVKRCRACLEPKPLDAFERCGDRGGVRAVCKACAPPRALQKINIAGPVAEAIRQYAARNGIPQSVAVAQLVMDGPDTEDEAVFEAEAKRGVPAPRPPFPSDRLVGLG